MSIRKAMYVLRFYDRITHVLTDERRICAPASTAGFEKMLAWAKSHRADHEYIGSIILEMVEKP